MATTSPFPPGALEWLAGPAPSQVLLIGAASYVPAFSRLGHEVTVIEPATSVTSTALRYPGAHAVAAAAEALPFDPRVFDTIVAIQNFHTVNPKLALPEWARVLRGGGHIALAYMVRDDSVPWVKKLRTIIQAYLPQAMAGEYGVESTAALTGLAAFPKVEQTAFRLWVPSTRAQLQDSARRAAGAEELSAEAETAMSDAIGQLYDEYARVPDPMKLPYQLRCWRAWVNNPDLTASFAQTSGLTIAF